MKVRRTWMLAVAGVTVLMSAVYALAFMPPDPAPYAAPAGTIIVCDAVVTGFVSGDVEGPFDGLAGPATFEHTSSSQAMALTQSTVLKLISFYHVFIHPEWGEVCVRGDETRPLTSSVTALQPNAAFPAKSTRHFHATLTIASIPGVTYTSVDPVLFEDRNVTEWPQNGARYLQIGEATFERSDRPGVKALKITGATLTLTGH